MPFHTGEIVALARRFCIYAVRGYCARVGDRSSFPNVYLFDVHDCASSESSRFLGCACCIYTPILNVGCAMCEKWISWCFVPAALNSEYTYTVVTIRVYNSDHIYVNLAWVHMGPNASSSMSIQGCQWVPTWVLA